MATTFSPLLLENLYTRNHEIMCKTIKKLQMVIFNNRFIGEALVPFYGQFLPSFNRFINRSGYFILSFSLNRKHWRPIWRSKKYWPWQTYFGHAKLSRANWGRKRLHKYQELHTDLPELCQSVVIFWKINLNFFNQYFVL